MVSFKMALTGLIQSLIIGLKLSSIRLAMVQQASHQAGAYRPSTS